jgi:NhaP-type Na+/H+ or K+/H+ antiporter
MIPVLLSLIKTGLPWKEKLFISWFGPRGLASIVFGIIVFDIGLPHKETIILTATCTILFSVISHGFTANPFIRKLNSQKTES